MINYVDKMADALVDVLRYSNNEVEWEEPDDIQPNDGLEVEWFYPAIESQGYSEITAILQYTQQQGVYDDAVGEILLGIALVEMKHYAVMRDLIVRLGGVFPRPYADNHVEIGSTVEEALEISMRGEMMTVDFYHTVEDKITQNTESTRIARQILRKIIADEILHLRIIKEKWLELAGEPATPESIEFARKIDTYLS